MASSIACGGVRAYTVTTRVAQGAGHTPANRLTVTFSLGIAPFFDTGHPCCGQLTTVKTKYSLTIIILFRAH